MPTCVYVPSFSPEPTSCFSPCVCITVLPHGVQVGAEIVLGDRDQRMTMQRMTALATQYRRKAMRQPTDQQLVPRHSSSQQGGVVQSVSVCL